MAFEFPDKERGLILADAVAQILKMHETPWSVLAVVAANMVFDSVDDMESDFSCSYTFQQNPDSREAALRGQGAFLIRRIQEAIDAMVDRIIAETRSES
jgi:hypothetical protein